jgi:hypothetical protein
MCWILCLVGMANVIAASNYTILETCITMAHWFDSVISLSRLSRTKKSNKGDYWSDFTALRLSCIFPLHIESRTSDHTHAWGNSNLMRDISSVLISSQPAYSMALMFTEC